jgi:tRNA modification GTPase
VILLGGSNASGILADVFRPAAKAPTPGATLRYGTIVDGGEVLDEVLVADPEGFECLLPRDARKQTFEVNAHGGPAAAEAVLGLLERRGALRIGWERFQRRFGPGARTPASWRAEVLLRRAKTVLAASALAEQAEGKLAETLKTLVASLEKASCGADPEEGRARALCEELLASAPLGRALAHPPLVLLCGPPNAGKSTLFNALAERDRAIVDETPGTTRDRITETVQLFGVPLLLSDSPGLTVSPSSAVEEAGIRATRASAGDADLRVFLFDGARPPSAEDLLEWDTLPAPKIATVGKSDLAASAEAACAVRAALGSGIAVLSGSRRNGLEGWKRAVLGALGIREPNPGTPAGPLLLGGRTEAVVREAKAALEAGEVEGIRRAARALRRAAGRDGPLPDRGGNAKDAKGSEGGRGQ